VTATTIEAHEGASVVGKAIVVATGVAERGDREVLGLAAGGIERGAFWTACGRLLRRAGRLPAPQPMRLL
jgi:transposase-like protein